MKKLILFILLAGVTLFTLYKTNTQLANKVHDEFIREHEVKKKRFNNLVNVEDKDKERISYYLQQKGEFNFEEAIVEFEKTKSMAVKSRIIENLTLYKLEEQKVQDFLRKLVNGDDKFIASIGIKNLTISKNPISYEITKELLLNEVKFDDRTYSNLIVSLAKKSTEENEKAMYVEKLKAMVDALPSVPQREVLKALLELTNGSQDIIDMINKKLESRNDLSFEMFAMTHLSKYDSTWIDSKRDKLMTHKNAQIRMMFVQNLKYYCPKDLWEVMEKFVQDENKNVRENLYRELTSFGKRSVPFLEKHGKELGLNQARVRSMLRRLKSGEYDKKDFCPNL